MAALVRSDETLEEIERELVNYQGDLIEACKACGLGSLMGQVYLWIENDPEVKERIRMAQLIGYSGLESEARRRAVDGVEEQVWFQGKVVGYKTVYSDGLLAQMLKARVPGYKEDAQAKGPVVQVNIVPRAESYEEWINMRERTLKQVQEVKVIEHDKSVEFLGKLMTQPPVEDNGLGDLGL